MNLIDLLLVLVILFGIWSGYRKGFIAGAVELLGLAIGLIFAFLAYRHVAAWLERHIPSLSLWSFPLAFVLCYFFIRIIFSAFAGSLRRLPGHLHQDTLNRLLGLIPGAVNGLINAAIICVLLLALPLSDDLSAKTRDSIITGKLSPYVAWAEDQFAPVFDRAIRHSMNRLTVEPSSDKSVDLPFSVRDPELRADLETAMLQMLNAERAKEGLKPLQHDPEMQAVARAHSRDMFARSYFSHITPEGKSPSDRARAAGVRFLAAGENLALAPTLEMAHTGLMRSPGHRANILRSAFGRVGIGILDGGRHGLIVTQNFRN